MNLKHAIAAVLVVLSLAACGAGSQTVARVDNVTLTRQELDQRIDRIEKGLQQQAGTGFPLPSRLDIEQELVSQFIDQQLTLGLARQRGITVSDADVNEQIERFRQQIQTGSGISLEQAIQEQLGLPGESSPEFRLFVTYFLARQKLGETLVSEVDIRQRISDEVMADTQRMVDVATVAHILVATEDEAKQVIERLDKGEDFADLAKELSQDPGSAENGGVYENIQRGQFVPEFDKAMFEDLQPGETTKTPVQTQFGWHVIRLVSRGEAPALDPANAPAVIEQRVAQELPFEQQSALERLLQSEKQKAIQEQRLVEPTFPTPTPEPLPTIAPLPTPAP
ncbi:peptidylprolyl isomerase [Roseiflexus castenholzii]|uniref:PpiC-type peptidyl-prolyl cis-trans isomerase n=1 Tax=Roseiflexus castenholzii (strain DSM 13941 / HLO8) TaxID=383372 RepID=A7NJP2_ROSCS|nr:peptidylprolyl isomerase [Roseiflexus castenholzii]ABU57712.1 PpiC-type peptidyl-prolyl cis-trans isomerase [Roseiflexus castenholzii DSM 13941]